MLRFVENYTRDSWFVHRTVFCMERIYDKKHLVYMTLGL